MAAYAYEIKPKDLWESVLYYSVGSTIVHSAACVINDIFDRNFDALVERTKTRPIPSGAASVPGAVIFLLAQVFAAVKMLSYTNALAFRVGLFGLFPIHTLYPLMKRWTNWPQGWLGFTMNWGLPVAWISITGTVDWKIIPALLLGTCSWTIVYDTIYACQDKKDDIHAGVKSTAILFGSYIRPILSLFAAHFVSSLAYAGYMNGQGPAFFVISVLGTALHFVWQLSTVDFEDGADCWRKFKANGDLGWLVWAGLLADYYVKLASS